MIRRSKRRFKTDLAPAVAEDVAALSIARESRMKERKAFYDAVDSEYWIAVCFQSREQKEAFLRDMEWGQFGDKYIDGRILAELAGVKLPDGPTFKTAKISRRLADLAESD